MTGERPTLERRAPDLLQFRERPDGSIQIVRIPGFTLTNPNGPFRPGSVLEGSPEEAALRKEYGLKSHATSSRLGRDGTQAKHVEIPWPGVATRR